MDTRKIATEYRLSEWSRIIKGRAESEMSVRAYCESLGIHQNVYYYWQKKLREAAVTELAKQQPKPSLPQFTVENERPVFSEIPMSAPVYTNAADITIRIGEIAVEIQNGADTATIESVLQILKCL